MQNTGFYVQNATTISPNVFDWLYLIQNDAVPQQYLIDAILKPVNLLESHDNCNEMISGAGLVLDISASEM